MHFTDGTACFASLFAKKKPQTQKQMQKPPQSNKKERFLLRRSIPNMKKKWNKKPHAHSRKTVDCLTLLECFTKSLISPYGIKSHSSSGHFTYILQIPQVERSCKFYSQFFSVLGSLYSIYKANFRHKFHLANIDDLSGKRKGEKYGYHR